MTLLYSTQKDYKMPQITTYAKTNMLIIIIICHYFVFKIVVPKWMHPRFDNYFVWCDANIMLVKFHFFFHMNVVRIRWNNNIAFIRHKAMIVSGKFHFMNKCINLDFFNHADISCIILFIYAYVLFIFTKGFISTCLLS